MKPTIIASVIFSVCLHVSCFDYCTVECDLGPGMHTVCKYPEGGGPSCKDFSQGLSEIDKKTILDMHNDLRQKVAKGQQTGQPSASNMMEMEWDEELEMIAQWWSIQCTKYLSHDACRNTHDGDKAGQNLAMYTGGNIANNIVQNMVQDWFNEVKYLDNINVDTFNPQNFMEVGHYTQMIWGLTSKIGCGYSRENTGSFRVILVCNYKPPGNIMHMPIYQSGEPCSACQSGTQCSTVYPGICEIPSDSKSTRKRSYGINLQASAGLIILNIFLSLRYKIVNF